MNKLLSLSFFVFFSAMAEAGAVGFAHGTEFSSSHIQGSVTVYCNSGEVGNFNCYDTVLDPNNYDYFVGPAGVTADQVALSNLREDGSRHERSDFYDDRRNRSEGAFNLWISSLFQRPLLGAGKNQIDFRLLNRGQIVQQGRFTVTVTRGAPRACPASHYNSNAPSDCTSQYTVCQRYFEQYNYCR